MARILVIYHRAAGAKWLPTYLHNLYSLERFSTHECFYLNAARVRVPRYLINLKPDLVVFHYTFLLLRQVAAEWERLLGLLDFTKSLDGPRVVIAQDEQVRMDLLNQFVDAFNVSSIFTPSPKASWARVYPGSRDRGIKLHGILTGYVDDDAVVAIATKMRPLDSRQIDVGYRSWYMPPFYGRHGQMKQTIGRVVQERATAFHLRTDISCEEKDALLGDLWFDFLLNCKYTIGVEGGCSVFDWDGTIAERTRGYIDANPGASYEEIEAACFPGDDSEFDYRLISPRHLEAVMTKTCQILVEGDYAGVLRPHEHYIPLKRDLSNVDEVLRLVAEDSVRAEMVERAYSDVVSSGRYSYQEFARLVFAETLPHCEPDSRWVPSARKLLNRLDEFSRERLDDLLNGAKVSLRRLAGRVLGEARLRGLLERARRP